MAIKSSAIDKKCKELCEQCAAGIPKERGVDDMGAEWWHKYKENEKSYTRHCPASDFIEGRLK